MQSCNITNNHLKDVMDNLRSYLEKEEEAPADLLLNFVFELKVSNLLIPQFRKMIHYHLNAWNPMMTILHSFLCSLISKSTTNM